MSNLHTTATFKLLCKKYHRITYFNFSVKASKYQEECQKIVVDITRKGRYIWLDWIISTPKGNIKSPYFDPYIILRMEKLEALAKQQYIKSFTKPSKLI